MAKRRKPIDRKVETWVKNQFKRKDIDDIDLDKLQQQFLKKFDIDQLDDFYTAIEKVSGLSDKDDYQSKSWDPLKGLDLDSFAHGSLDDDDYWS